MNKKVPLSLVEELLRVKTQKELAEKEYERVSKHIKELMEEKEEIVIGNWKLTLPHREQKRIDPDLVRKRDPKLAEECTVTIMTRPLGIKPWLV